MGLKAVVGPGVVKREEVRWTMRCEALQAYVTGLEHTNTKVMVLMYKAVDGLLGSC